MVEKILVLIPGEKGAIKLEGNDVVVDVDHLSERGVWSSPAIEIRANKPDADGRQGILYHESFDAWKGDVEHLDLRLPEHAYLREKFRQDLRADMLRAFEKLCKNLNKVCRGFDVEAIDGKHQWALKYTPNAGWMVVCGLGGCGAALSRWCGYMPSDRAMLYALEMANIALRKDE